MGNRSSSTSKNSDDMVGFRVKEIKKLSPAAKCGLILSSDYVLSAAGKTLRLMEPAAIAQLIKSHENKELHMKVFNDTTCKIRDIVIIPTQDWPGEGLMGVVLKLESYDPYARTSTGDFNITFDDVYTKDNPVSRRPSGNLSSPSSPRERNSEIKFTGNNTFYQNSTSPKSPDTRRR